MANLYFTEDRLESSSTTVSFVGDEARHAVQVARLRVGETVEVSDGRGHRAVATVTTADKARVDCSVDSILFEPESSPRFVLAQALAKGDRDELAIQTATELGVARVIPWQADRSVSKWVGDKVAKGVSRWTSIVREAAKQSMRSRIPEVSVPVTTSTLCASDPESAWIVLDPRADQTLSEWFAANSPRSVGIIVGPEGGITDDEIRILVASGAAPVRLNSPILRTSTAGPAAIAALNALSGAW